MNDYILMCLEWQNRVCIYEHDLNVLLSGAVVSKADVSGDDVPPGQRAWLQRERKGGCMHSESRLIGWSLSQVEKSDPYNWQSFF